MKKTSKKKAAFNIDVTVNYELISGDCGVCYRSLHEVVPIYNGSSDDAIALVMNHVIEREHDFFEVAKDEKGWIHWTNVKWKCEGVRLRTESLRLCNTKAIAKAITAAKPNYKN